MERPGATNGLRHVALFVQNFEETEAFYVDLLGMRVEWRPDEDNVYLTSGNDNLALHRVKEPLVSGRLDHIGFFVNQIEKIDEWFAYLGENNIKMFTEPRTHRDGARSFYCADPSGTRVQMIYHIPISVADGNVE
ncbi:MAG: VOC family protein [Proteobacteria bacterium]|nr:VOC family protein [Pseudomonadota bacterium]